MSVSVPLDKIRETLLVRIESSEGHVGWGETSPLPGTKAAIDELGVSLVGQNPLHYRRLWRSLWGANFGNALAVAGLDMAINDLNFECFEEPMPQSPKYAAYEELRERLPLSLAAGEAVDGRASAKELIDRRAMDIIQPDVSLCGGFAEALFIAEMAALSGVRVIPHCWGADILIAATVQLLSLLPDPHWGSPSDTPLLELDQSENPWRNGLAKGAFPLQDGMVHVPTGPGLGIAVDEQMVKEFSV